MQLWRPKDGVFVFVDQKFVRNASSVRSFVLSYPGEIHWSQTSWHHFTQWTIASNSNQEVLFASKVIWKRNFARVKKGGSNWAARHHSRDRICKTFVTYHYTNSIAQLPLILTRQLAGTCEWFNELTLLFWICSFYRSIASDTAIRHSRI